MGKLVDKSTGARVLFDDADVPAALASGKYIDPGIVPVHRFGEDTYATPQLATQEEAFSRRVSGADVATEHGHQIRSDENSGLLAGAKALGGAAIGSASFGLLSPFQDEQEFNPGAAVAGTVIGAVAPMLVGDFGDLAGGAELGSDALSAERATSSLSSKFLHADEIGAEAGSAAKSLERGMARGQGELAEARAPIADLATLDRKGLDAARETEVANLEASRVPDRKALVDELSEFRNDTAANKKLFLATKDADVKGIGEIKKMSKVSLDADRQIDRLLNNPFKLAENPKPALGALQQQENALMRISKSDAELRAVFAADETGTRVASLDAIPGVLEKNRALQQRIRALTEPATSERLAAIDEAKAALSGGATAPKSWLEHAVGGAAFSAGTAIAAPLGHLAPIVGAKASKFVSDVLFGRLARATAGVGERSKAALAAFLDTSGAVAKSAPVLATRVLAQLRYAPTTPGGPQASPKDDNPTLSSAYHARSAEIRSQTVYGPDGRAVMRPEARARLADRLDPIRAINPVLADRMETLAVRRLEFLANHLPRRPDFGALRTGPDHWSPSDMDMREFARYAAGVEDPGGIEERLATGAVTPEDGEVMREVYPERMAEITRQISQRLPELRKSLPYHRRLALSIFSGVPVDPAMQPEILAVLQAQFETGELGAGPTAQPQFGSVSKSVPDPTPAQRRGGA